MSDDAYRDVSSVADSRNQSFLLGRYHFRSQAFKELAFELFRRDHQPHLPSRRTCLYVMDDAALWMPTLSSPAAPRLLYEVRLLEGSKTLRADAQLLGKNNLRYEEFEALARRYWSGEGTALPEILVEGQVQVVQRIDFPAATLPTG